MHLRILTLNFDACPMRNLSARAHWIYLISLAKSYYITCIKILVLIG